MSRTVSAGSSVGKNDYATRIRLVVSQDLAHELYENLPEGILTPFREKASFDWKLMKLHFNGGNEVATKKETLLQQFNADPLFHPSPRILPMEELRKNLVLQSKALYKKDLFTEEESMQNPMVYIGLLNALSSIDVALMSKYNLSSQLVGGTIQSMGDDEAQFAIREKILTNEYTGCFALTELTHGSNTKHMKTTAVYCPKTQQFILNTPTMNDMKCWVGNLGQCATHALTFAQLITPDGVQHGLHMFLVPVRHPKTLKPFPGVICGDMGSKIGQNGLDNGFLMFKHYAIPRNMLLNKSVKFDVHGHYASAASSDADKASLTLGALSISRAALCTLGPVMMAKALTIALRYSHARRQFCADDEKLERPVISYQLHRARLVPHLAATFILQYASFGMFRNCVEFQVMRILGEGGPEQIALGKELHVVSCVAKAIQGWAAQRCIQECREACGGHGYLYANRFGCLRDENDPVLTFEGDNNLILQQTTNYLLQLYRECFYEGPAARKKVASALSPFKIVPLVLRCQEVVRESRCPRMSSFDGWLDVDTLLRTMEFAVSLMLIEAADRNHSLRQARGMSAFDARNNAQAFYLHPLAKMFGEYSNARRFVEDTLRADHDETPPQLVPVLTKLFQVHCLTVIDNYQAWLWRGGYFAGHGASAAGMLQPALLHLFDVLEPELAALADVLAIPDELLGAPIGAADGKVYERLIDTIMSQPDAIGRPEHWRDIVSVPVKSDESDVSISKM